MFDGIPFGNLTAPALVGIAVLLVIFGRLVPWYIYKEKVKEAENWRKVAETEREARVASNAQTAELLELARTTHAIVIAVFGNAAIERSNKPGEPDVVPTSTRK